MMSDNVYWIVDAAIKPGQLDAFKAMADEMTKTVQADEPGALAYEWTISADEGTCHIYERYTDSEVALAHLKWFGKNYGERFMSLADQRRLTVYGSPDQATRKVLDRLGATYMTPVVGFSR